MISLANIMFENVVCIFFNPGENSYKTHQKVTDTHKDNK